MLKKTILFDVAHNEMLNIDDKEFSEFSNLLRRLDINIKKNESEHLTKELVMAVLRVDKRGVGESTGDFEEATTEDIADDVKVKVIVVKGEDCGC